MTLTLQSLSADIRSAIHQIRDGNSLRAIDALCDIKDAIDGELSERCIDRLIATRTACIDLAAWLADRTRD